MGADNQRSNHALATAVLLGTLVLIASCGESGSGSGGGLGSGSGGGAGIVTPYTNLNVNGSLQGEIWSSAEQSRMNVSTGEIKTIANNPVYPSRDGLEYAELVSEYKTHLEERCGFLSPKSDAIVIRDSVNDHPKQLIESREILRGPISFSPDGQTLALWASSSGRCPESYDDRFPTLLNRNGDVIARASDRVISFDWLPDNRLAFILNDDGVYKFVVGNEDEPFNGFVRAVFPPLNGVPSRLRVSPDGQQVMLEVFIGGPTALTFFEFREATVWIMNIDGTNFRQLADTSRPKVVASDEPLINEPVWSPDSQNVLLTENFTQGSQWVTGVDINSPTLESIELYTVNYNYLTYVMPANSALTLLPPENISTSGVRPLLTSNSQGQVRAHDINPMARQSWTPAVAQSTFSSGPFPRPNGQVNRGLSGHIYVEPEYFDSDIEAAIAKINLTTNEKTIIELDSDVDEFGGFDVSKSQNRIAMFHMESFDERYINIYDSNGQRLNSFIQANRNYNYSRYGSKVRISPQNEDWLAWPYWNSDTDEQGIVVLNAQASQFQQVFNERRYDDFNWFPNGDLLLVEDSSVYRARSNGVDFDSAELLFQHVVDLSSVEVAPNGQRLVFHSLGNIFTINLDGTGLAKVMSSTTHRYGSPSWSPDGQFLLFNSDGSESGNGFDSKYFVSATAMNVPLYHEYAQDSIMEIGEAAATDHDYDGRYVWR